MSLFKKPKKTFRSRRLQENSDEDDDVIIEKDDDVIIESFVPASCLKQTDPSKKSKDKKKKKKESKDEKKTSSTLSFGDEEGEEEEVFQIKKSSHSRRVAKMLKREHKKEREEAEQQSREAGPASGTYSDETLRQLRAEQDSQNGHAPVDMELGSDVERDGSTPSRPPSLDDLDDDDDNNGREASPETQQRRDPLAGDNFRDMLTGGGIPDASLIHMARKRRQQARERGDESYIPLDDTRRAERNTSRLVREDDNDRSDDDEEPVHFSAASREQHLRKIRDTILDAEQGSHSEGSDQEKDWEEQQIRKGVQAGTTTAQGETTDTATKQYQQLFFGNAPPSTQYLKPSPNDPGPSILASRAAPPKHLPPVTLENIKKRIKDRLDDLSSVHRAHVHERDDLESRMENCSIDIGSRSGGHSSLEGRYRFFQQMRGYVRDLVDCLAEKMVSINYLDRCVMQQWEKRADKLIKRRQQDVKDQAKDYMPNKPVVAPTLSPEEVEEDLARQRRTAEREARRARRRRARERAVHPVPHHDGTSTDDEENQSTASKYTLERGHLHTSVDSLFDDVVDDFNDVNLIKSRFEDWKREQGHTYTEAYIGLCLPKLFMPIVKWNLIEWNPLEPNCRRLDESPWYEALMFYGFSEGHDLDPDSDLRLVPSIVEKVVLAKITALVESVWDPLSTKQTQRLIAVLNTIVHDYPTINSDSKNTQTLLQAVVQRIRGALADDVFVPLYSKQVLENRSSQASQFFHRQMWSCIKLLGNILSWRGILSDTALQQLGLDFLLNRYLILALHNSPVTADSLAKSLAITATLPPAWFTSLPSDSTLPQLENFCRHLVNTAGVLSQSQASAKTEAERCTTRESLQHVRKMLVTLHALDHASALADRLGLKASS